MRKTWVTSGSLAGEAQITGWNFFRFFSVESHDLDSLAHPQQQRNGESGCSARRP